MNLPFVASLLSATQGQNLEEARVSLARAKAAVISARSGHTSPVTHAALSSNSPGNSTHSAGGETPMPQGTEFPGPEFPSRPSDDHRNT